MEAQSAAYESVQVDLKVAIWEKSTLAVQVEEKQEVIDSLQQRHVQDRLGTQLVSPACISFAWLFPSSSFVSSVDLLLSEIEKLRKEMDLLARHSQYRIGSSLSPFFVASRD